MTKSHPGASKSAQAKDIKKAPVGASQGKQDEGIGATNEQDNIAIEEDCLRFLWCWRNIAHSPRTICDSLAPRRSLTAITKAVQRLADRGYLVVNIQRESPEETFWSVKYPDFLPQPQETKTPPRGDPQPSVGTPQRKVESPFAEDALMDQLRLLNGADLELRGMLLLVCAYINWQPKSDSPADSEEADAVTWAISQYGERLGNLIGDAESSLTQAHYALK